MIYNTILEAMGHTPIIRLQHLPDPQGAQVLVKFEGLNVGGSIKTRTAYQMIENAERDGRSEEEKDVIKYDYQLMDDAWWLLNKGGYIIVEKDR